MCHMESQIAGPAQVRRKKEVENTSILIQHCQSFPHCEMTALPTAGNTAKILYVFYVVQVSLKDLWKKAFFPARHSFFYTPHPKPMEI